ncbi:glycosyltransferase [Nonomuraea sp. SMC257]|uniref:Glycosyltransferase n=1 Tax=Nonomuraea montanisoli TaxID=2741721 RepID=A0A7Y6M1W2_9ACTN|nr:PqqD family peptide modification chaperone [Nonomuraea montanisoli]NUW30529.1 glycosyltransferase [Nonomuraea montanisoli]
MSVGVVIPAFQPGDALEQAIASVASQTRPPDSVIVINVGSDELVASSVARWTRILPIIHLQTDTRVPPGIARDFGIRHSNTDYIAQLDADDIWLPNHLQAMLATLDGRVRLVAAEWFDWDADVLQSRLVTRRHHARDAPWRTESMTVENHIGSSAVLYERAIYLATGGYADIERGEDWDLWLRMLRQGVEMKWTSGITCVRRLHHAAHSRGVRSIDTDEEVLTRVLAQASDHADQQKAAALALLIRLGSERYVRRVARVETSTPDDALVNELLRLCPGAGHARDLGAAFTWWEDLRLGPVIAMRGGKWFEACIGLDTVNGRPLLSFVAVSAVTRRRWRLLPAYLNSRAWGGLRSVFPSAVGSQPRDGVSYWIRSLADRGMRESLAPKSAPPPTTGRLTTEALAYPHGALRPRADLLYSRQWTSETGVLIDKARGVFKHLSPMGTRIWEQLQRSDELGTLVDHVCENSDDPGREDEVLRVLTELIEAQLILVAPSTS